MTWPRERAGRQGLGALQGGCPGRWTQQRCEEEMRNTSPCTRILFLAGDQYAGMGPLCKEDIPQTRTCTADLFLLDEAAAWPIAR